MKNIIPFFMALLFAHAAQSQDLIIKKNNEQIKAKIIDIGSTEVKFKYFDSPDGPTITILKSEIKTLKIQGKTEKTMAITEDPMSVSNNTILDKNGAIKFDFFSPLNRNIAIGYEWVYKPGLNFEVGAGIIGPGANLGKGKYSNIYHRDPSGGFLRLGCKLLMGNNTDFAVDGVKFAHPLKGRFFKVDLTLNSFSTNYQFDTLGILGGLINPIANIGTSKMIAVNKSYTSASLNLSYGRQFILGNSMTLGYNVGFGYAIEKSKSDLSKEYLGSEPKDRVRYSHWYFGKDLPLTFTAGLSVGYILKAPKWLPHQTTKPSNQPPSRDSMDNK